MTDYISNTSSSDRKEILITGMSGNYPKSTNIKKLLDNLYNKVDMMSDSKERLAISHPLLPKTLGLNSEMEYFDAQFFAVNYRQARHFEPITRKLLEVACEAIIDAGVNPRSLRNSNTGVFIGTAVMDCEIKFSCHRRHLDGYSLLGTARTMMANRISYWLGARGPSYTIFGECCSTALALNHAFHALETGQCEAAIVGGGNLILEPTVALQIHWLNYSTSGSKTKCYSEDADGSVRSDCVVAIFLQKAKDSKRVYAQLVHSKACTTGLVMNDQHYLHPSGENLRVFLKDFYTEINVKPEELEYIEGCGTAIKKTEYEELQNIDEIFCSGLRKKPLLVGSVKSNIGNTESASTLTSIIKVLLAYHKGEIAGNLNLENPRKDVKAIQEGRIRLVDDNMKFNKGYTGVISYSYVGICSHFLLKSYTCDVQVPKTDSSIPYLICASGRIEKSIEKLFDDLVNKPLDAGQIALLHNTYANEIPGFITRGYNILSSRNETTVSLSKTLQVHDGRQRPIWFVYSGMGSQWPTMGAHLMRLPIFSACIHNLHQIMEPFGLNLTDIITKEDPNAFDNIIYSFVGIAAVQIGLTDVLRALKLEPDYIIGHSVGELGCAYADGCLTAEEMILSAYYRGLVSSQTSFIRGSMAAVGLGFGAIKTMCPPEIAVACHNGPESCTLSGPAEDMTNFVTKLKAQGFFAKEVACSNIAYHSKYIAEAGPALKKYMAKVIKNPKPRSPKWISSSVPQSAWDKPHAKLCSADYLTNNLLSPVLFEESSKLIPDYAITIEIAPHGLLQAILKRSLPKNCVHLPLTRRGHSDNVVCLLESIGQLFMHGVVVQPKNLYTPVKFPVPSETPLLGHTTAWEHSEVWPTTPEINLDQTVTGERKVILTKHDKDLEYLKGYVVNGYTILPAAAQLVLIWETLANIQGVPFQEMPVIFKNVRFDSDVVVPEENCVELVILLQKYSGNFEISLQNSTVASGQVISVPKMFEQHKVVTEPLGDVILDESDVYRIFTLKGYSFSGDFKSIKSIDSNYNLANVEWKGNWVTFLDSLIQTVVLSKDKENASKPKHIESLEINTKIHKMCVADCKGVLEVFNYDINNICSCAGVNLINLITTEVKQIKSMIKPMKALSNFENFKLQVVRPGDLNSLTWVQAPKPHSSSKTLVQVYYTRLSHADLLLVQGKHVGECGQVKEFGNSYSGVTTSGKRIMGVVKEGAMSGIVDSDESLSWVVPQHWTLQEAATVPLAYVQALYILHERAELKPNSTVLVTQGSSPLGQAIISACLNLNCKIFTTIRNKTHKTMLMKIFPELNENHICVSRDSEIVEAVLRITNGLGCDVVINSLNGGDRQLLMSTVGDFGNFVDLSQLDMEENAHFGMSFLVHGKNYKAVNFNSIYNECNSELRRKLKHSVHTGISEGWIRPIASVVYDVGSIRRAFQLLNCKRNFGAILLNLSEPALAGTVSAVPQWKCEENKSFIIVCGNNALGVEMVGKLTQLGAKRIVVHTQQESNYLKMNLRSTPEVDITLTSEDLKTETGCMKLLSLAEKLGQISVLFVVKPSVSEGIVKNLDSTSRRIGLRNFVILNPCTSAETTNINVLKTICMERVRNNLLGRIIQCTVNLNENNEEIELLTVALNKMINCLETSMMGDDIVVTVDAQMKEYHLGISDIINILGLSQSNNLSMTTSLNKMGVKLSSTKLLSLLLKHYNSISYTPEMLLNMTLKSITECQSEQTVLPTPTKNPFGVFFSFYDNDYERTTFVPIIWMPTLYDDYERGITSFEYHDGKDYMIVLPGMEGLHYSMTRVCRRLKMKALVYQFADLTQDSIHEMAAFILEDVKKHAGVRSKFYILGYSFGVLLTLEIAALFEKEGILGKVFCLDASPSSLKRMLHNQTSSLSLDQQESLLLLHGCQLMLPNKNTDDLKKTLENTDSWELKLKETVKYMTFDNCSYIEFTQLLLSLARKRIDQMKNFKLTFEKLDSDVVLVKSRDSEEDYGLGSICSGSYKEYNLASDHKMVPYNLRVSDIINRELCLE